MEKARERESNRARERESEEGRGRESESESERERARESARARAREKESERAQERGNTHHFLSTTDHLINKYKSGERKTAQQHEGARERESKRSRSCHIYIYLHVSWRAFEIYICDMTKNTNLMFIIHMCER